MSERTIFLTALEFTNQNDRAAYLDAACEGNPALRREVEALLRSHDAAGSFLEPPAQPGSSSDTPTQYLSAESQQPPETPDAVAAVLELLAPSDRPDARGRIGHYDVLEVLGHGAFGVVLRAFDSKLHRIVAIKAMNPEMAATSPPRKRFLREARSAAAVKHEHIVSIYSVEEEPLPYLVMEYVSGKTLQTWLDEHGPLEPLDVVQFGRQIAAGLAAAHAQGLIHRDIKPANILLETGLETRAKITDFGLARAADDASLTQSGLIAGTPLYMAPEQAKGQPLDGRADLFSLGSVLYTMLSGRPPFRAPNTIAVLRRVCEDTPRAIGEVIPGTPPWLCDIITKLHAKEPADRFQSATEVVQALDAGLAYLKDPQRAPQPAVKVPVSHAGPSVRVTRPTSKLSRFALWTVITVCMLPVLGCLLGIIAIAIPAYQSAYSRIPVLPDTNEPRGLRFDGKDDYVKVAGLDWSYPQFTLEAFVTSANDGDNGVIAMLYSRGEQPEAMFLFDGPAGTQHRMSGAGVMGKKPFGNAMAPLTTGVRQHRALVFDGEVLNYYVNGVWQGKRYNQAKEGLQWQIDNLLIGCKSTDTEFFRGVIDQVRVSRVARYTANFPAVTSLTADDTTLALYNFDEGTGDTLRDSSGHNHHARIHGATWINPSARGLTDEWITLFNGRDLTGWQPNDQWKVENGVLVSRVPHNASAPPPMLVTERRDFRDFHARLEAKLNHGGDSGFFFRFGDQGKSALQAQLTAGPTPLGSLLSGPDTIAVSDRSIPHDVWFTLEVVARGPEVAVSINGQPAVLLRSQADRGEAGPFALESGFAGTEVMIRKLEVRAPSDTPTNLPIPSTAPTPYEILTSPDYEWTPPENLGPAVNTPVGEKFAALTGDGLRLVFFSHGRAETGLSEATRTRIDEPFGGALPLGEEFSYNSVHFGISLSADGLVLVFSSGRPGGPGEPGNMNLWQATRPDLSTPFGKPTCLTTLNTDGDDVNPCLSADGLTIRYQSLRLGRLFWMSRRPSRDAEFPAPTPVDMPLLPGVTSYSLPGQTLSSDERVLIFTAAYHDQVANKGVQKLVMSVRPTSKASFGTPVDLGPVVSGEFDVQYPTLSADGTVLIFDSWRPGSVGAHPDSDLWMTRRVKKTTAVVGPSVLGGNQALEFDGVDDHVEIPTLRLEGLPEFTVEARFRQTLEPGQKGTILAGLSDPLFALDVNEHGQLSGYLMRGRLPTGVFGPKNMDQAWHHVAATVRSGKVALYLDGKPLPIEEPPFAVVTDDVNVPRNRFLIGAGQAWNVVHLIYPFRGAIDELRLSRTIRHRGEYQPSDRLDADEETLALYHFDEGRGTALTDASGHGHHGLIVGATWIDGPTQPASSAGIDLLNHPVVQQSAHTGKGLRLENGALIFTSSEADGLAQVWIDKLKTRRGRVRAVLQAMDPVPQGVVSVGWDYAGGNPRRVDAVLHAPQGTPTASVWEFGPNFQVTPLSDETIAVDLSQPIVIEHEFHDGAVRATIAGRTVTTQLSATSDRKAFPYLGVKGTWKLTEWRMEDLEGAEPIQPPSPPGIDAVAERRAAEWVMANAPQGRLVIMTTSDNKQIELTGAQALPMEPFVILRADLIRLEQNLDDGLRKLAACPKLTGIHLAPTEGISAETLFALRQFTNLEELQLVGGGREYPGLDEALGATISQLPKLHRLEVKYLSNLSDRMVETLAALPELRSFKMDGTSLTDAGLERLGSIAPRLEELEYGYEKRTSLLSAAKFPKLVSLMAPGAKVTEAGVAALGGLPELRMLSLGHDCDTALARLLPLAPKLEELALNSPRISPAGYAALRQFTRLELLALNTGSQSPTDEDLLAFAAWPRLKRLFLHGFPMVANDHQLARLWTDAGLAAFRLKRPDVRLEIDGQAVPAAPPVGWQNWPADAPPPAIAPFDAAQAKAHQEAWAKHLGVPVEYTNSIGMKFRLIPPGEFTMGSTPEEIAAALKDVGEDQHSQACIISAAPRHKVILTQPIYLGVNEVTQAEYERVMGTNPSQFAPMGDSKDAVAGLDTSQHPVENLSWNDAAEFCVKLCQQEKLKPFYFRAGESITLLDGTGYRLPSEAEWEFACRAGTTTKYWLGDQDDVLTWTGWFGGNSGGRTHAVGELKANPFGLHDTHGNVLEWVQDGWDATYYGRFQDNPAINPDGPIATGSYGVHRGGGFAQTLSSCRSSARHADLRTSRIYFLGFRTSLPVDAVKELLKRVPPPAIAPFDAAQATAHQEAWAKHLGVPVEYTNSIGMKFRLIPPGEFTMGSTPEEIAEVLKFAGDDRHWQECVQSAGPRHKVILTRPIYLGVHEVTQTEYAKVIGLNPSHFHANGDGKAVVAGLETANHPVETVAWNDAAEFCAKLSQQEAFKPFYFRAGGTVTPLDGTGYRLPTEAEWEFASRAGTTTRFWSGDSDESLAEVGWSGAGSGERTHAVGELKANPFGLFDVHGNVWEWVQDGWDLSSYRQFLEQAAIDPHRPFTGSAVRSIRGGRWGNYPAAFSRSSFRYARDPSHADHGIGFRVALPVEAVRAGLAGKVSGNPPPSLNSTEPQRPELSWIEPEYAALNRRAAEAALNAGGSVWGQVIDPTNGRFMQDFGVNVATALPVEPFILKSWSVKQNHPEAQRAFATVAGLRHLDELVFHATTVRGVELSHLREARSLWNFGITTADWKTSRLAELTNRSALRVLWLHARSVDDAWASLADCSALRVVWCDNSDTEIDLSGLAQAPGLRYIFLTKPVTDEAVAAVQAAHPRLQIMVAEPSGMRAAGIDRARAAMIRLYERGWPILAATGDWAYQPITDRVQLDDPRRFQWSCGRQPPVELQPLDQDWEDVGYFQPGGLWRLRGHQHADAMARGVAAHVCCLNLDFSDSTLTDEGLAALQSLTALRTLYVTGCPVSEAAVQAFHRAHPEVLLATSYGNYGFRFRGAAAESSDSRPD